MILTIDRQTDIWLYYVDVKIWQIMTQSNINSFTIELWKSALQYLLFNIKKYLHQLMPSKSYS